MKTYFQDNKSKKLILFFNGWGMDERPLLLLKSSYDILHVFDYNNLDFSPNIEFSKYEKIVLIAFSAGVFVTALVHDKLPKLNFKIAVNGTLNLFSNEFGVPDNILSQMKALTLENALEFRKNFIEDKTQLDLFNSNQPLRTLESSLSELARLEDYPECSDFEYNKVIISRNDEIIPSRNQVSAWGDYKNINFIDGGHFIFYKFELFDDIITF